VPHGFTLLTQFLPFISFVLALAQAWQGSQVSGGLWPTFEIRLFFLREYIHGQAPTAKKFTHHNIRKKE
jgi:hypothetical protein